MDSTVSVTFKLLGYIRISEETRQSDSGFRLFKLELPTMIEALFSEVRLETRPNLTAHKLVKNFSLSISFSEKLIKNP